MITTLNKKRITIFSEKAIGDYQYGSDDDEEYG